jgi:dipeptidyl aminopeptidase/acylaminoacyl peptidase
MRFGSIAAAILFCFAPFAAAAAPLEAYGQLPSLDQFTISPDGKNIAYVTNVNGKRTVLINSIAQGQVIGGIDVNDQKLRDLTWADNDNLLLTMSVTHVALGGGGPRSEYFMTQTYRLSDKIQKALLKHGNLQMNVVLDYPRIGVSRGQSTIYVPGITFKSDQGQVSLFAIDPVTGQADVVEVGNSLVNDWIIDGDGAVVGRTLYDSEKKIWSLQITQRVGYATVFSIEAPIETPIVQGITKDGSHLLLAIKENDGWTERMFNMVTGKWETPLAGADPYGAPIIDPATRRLIGMGLIGDRHESIFFEKADQDAWNAVARAFPDEDVRLSSWSNDRKTIVVHVDGKRDGNGFFLIDLNTHQASFLGSAYAGIEAADRAEVKFVTYTAADGMKIPAYLTLPNGKAPKGLPLVVLPHGGPAARDEPGFYWLAQALASRGYAVLQPEFRGSDGFGWSFMAAGFGEWGRKMQTDLSDGVRYLAGQGIIDAKRVCIVGGSYGGYAALAGAALDRGVYRCAVADAPVSDPASMMKWIRDRQWDDDTISQRYWQRFMGAKDYNDPKLSEVSPLAHAADVGIPILIIHGKDDTVVPISQSEAMEDALKKAGKPVTFIRLEGEDHWLSKAETRLQMLQATVQFLEANNPP